MKIESLDLYARRVTIASLLYYSVDISMMPDGEFDELCKFIQANWEGLEDIRKWQLNSSSEIAASGAFCKVTMQGASAAAHWMTEQGHTNHPLFYAGKSWNIHPKYGRWLTSSDFRMGR